jgi:uncharacterized FlaG/YvyC family protein
MASDGSPGAIPAATPVVSSPAADPTKFQPGSGKSLPQSGNGAAQAPIPASQGRKTLTLPASSVSSTSTANASNLSKSQPAKTSAASNSDPQALVDQINKRLNDSGRADQFRVDPTSEKYIQQVNPASGEVIAEYSVNEFPALARSIGASGLLVDETA